MLRRAARAALVLALILLLPGAAAADTGKTVTATGSGQVTVKPTNPNDEASIRTAVDFARTQAVPLALADARQRAGTYAAAAGLTLGGVQAVADTGLSGFAPFAFPAAPPPFAVSFAPGGAETFCGIVRRPVYRKVGGHRKLVRVISRRTCFVPPYALATLTVTYAAG